MVGMGPRKCAGLSLASHEMGSLSTSMLLVLVLVLVLVSQGANNSGSVLGRSRSTKTTHVSGNTCPGMSSRAVGSSRAAL